MAEDAAGVQTGGVADTASVVQGVSKIPSGRAALEKYSWGGTLFVFNLLLLPV